MPKDLTYINSLNGGQISEKLAGRSDIPQYWKSCKTLRNFLVLSQGGVERRPGSHYVGEALSDKSRLIPFQFSRDESYILEINSSEIRVFNSTGLIADSLVSPWTDDQITELKFKQLGDLIYFVCGDVKPQIFARVDLAPTFSIGPISYDYPPLLKENSDPTHNMKVTELSGTYYLETDIVGTFTSDDVDKEFQVECPRSPLTITDTIGTGSSVKTIDVSFSNWKLTTGGTWNGEVYVERKIGSVGVWEDYLVIGDTTGINANNFTVTPPISEGKDVEIRMRYVKQTNDLQFTLTALSTRQPSIVHTESFINSQKMEVSPITYIGELDEYTSHWAEGAYSDHRGHPSTVEYHENRLVFCGSISETSTIYMSETDNYMTFRVDDLATAGLKIKPITNEPATWLISKGDLMQGTRGSLITVQSNDKKAISYANTSAVESNAFGGSYIQAVKTNETVVYIEAGSKKLREVFYSDEEQSIISRDLTILSDDIGGHLGFTELILQKIPDQIIWGLREDGLLAGLTYERSQDIYGWHVHDFGGDIKSVAVRTGATIDELWMIIDRDGNHYIEFVGTRNFSDDLLDAWFVDSAIHTELEELQTTDSITWNGTIFTLGFGADHDLTTGDKIRLTNAPSGITELENSIYTVGATTTSSFVLRSEDDSVNVNPTLFDDYSTPVVELMDVTQVSQEWNGLSHLEGETIQILGDGGYCGTEVVTGGGITCDTYINQTTIGLRYLSILQPMLLDSKNYVSIRNNKVILDCIVKIYRSMSYWSGIIIQDHEREEVFDFDDVNENFPNMSSIAYEQYPVVLRTLEDPLGNHIDPFTGTNLIQYNDAWSRLKSYYIIGDLPQPLSILSIGVNLGIGN